MKWIKPAIRGITRLLQKQPLNSSTEIRLTRLCSQRCRQCSVYERKTGPHSMSWENFRFLAERLRQYGAYIGFISGGEATLVPHLDKILIEAKKIFSIATTLVTGLYNKTHIIQYLGLLALDNDINIQTSLDGLGTIGDSLRGVTRFSDTVLGHMKWLAERRRDSKSLLYANIVLNNLNLDQVPELVRRTRDLDWKCTIGLYHTLTGTTRFDDELQLRTGTRLDRVLRFLENNPDVLNLDSFIRGIGPFISERKSRVCAFTDSPIFSTRTTIMENGDVHLCHGSSIGNIFEEGLEQIFTSDRYHRRLDDYRKCAGCWTTCYTQRYLLVHPSSFKELVNNIKKIKGTKAERN